MATKQKHFELADGSLTVSETNRIAEQSGDWTDDVDQRVVDHYQKHHPEVTAEQIEDEKQWELKAHERAKDRAHEELLRLSKKKSASSFDGLDRLMMTLTIKLMEEYIVEAHHRRSNKLEKEVTQYINAVRGPEDLLAHNPDFTIRHFHNISGRDAKSAGDEAYLNLLSCGFLVIKTIGDYSSALADSKDAYQILESDLSRAIGQALNKEVQMIGFQRLNVGNHQRAVRTLPPGTTLSHAQQRLSRQMVHWVERMHAQRKISKKAIADAIARGEDPYKDHPDLRLPTTDDYAAKWNDDKCKRVGSVYLKLLGKAGIIESVHVGKGLAAGWDGKIRFTQAGLKIYSECIDRDLLSQFQHVPMLIPPLPHSCRKGGGVAGRDVGGYILDAYAETHRRTVSHSSLGFHTSRSIREGDGEPEWINQLNRAQEVPQRLNTDLYERVILPITNGQVPVTSGSTTPLSVHSLTLLSKPRKDDLQAISDHYSREIEQAQRDGDIEREVKLKREVRYKKKQIHEQAQRDQGNASRIRTLLETCRLLNERIENGGHDNRYFINWFACSRRRMYGLGALNPTEREVAKSLIFMDQKVDFTNNAEREKSVREDLLWHLATTWDKKAPEFGDDKSSKLSRDERILWASLDSQLEIIERIGADPMAYDNFIIWAGEKDSDYLGRTVISGGAGDPFMFVAACIEWVELFVKKSRTYTHLPVGLDCTGSGLQIASFLCNDKKGGVLCNAAASDTTRPGDIYTAILARAMKIYSNDEGHFRHFINQEIYEDILGDNRVKERLETFGLGRSCAKPVGMIATYGGKAETNERDVLDKMKEDGKPFLPQFVGFDERHHDKVRELDVKVFQRKVRRPTGEKSAKGATLTAPLWDNAKAMFEEIDEMKRESLTLFKLGRSSMSLFQQQSEVAPEKPIEGDSTRYGHLDEAAARKKWEQDLADYGLEMQYLTIAQPRIERQNAAAARRFEALIAYTNLVRSVHGLEKRAFKAYPRVRDVDPLIYDIVRAMRVALEGVAPGIIRFRDKVKEAISKNQDVVIDPSGAITYDMPHGWRTRQRHLKGADVVMSSQLQVFSAPMGKLDNFLSWWGTLFDQHRDGDIEKLEERIQSHKNETKGKYWKLNPDVPVDEMKLTSPRSVTDKEVDVAKHKDAIVANLVHSCDSALATEIRIQLGKRGIDMMQVHDCFFVTCGFTDELLKATQDAIAALFGDAVGENRPLEMFARSIKVPSLPGAIRLKPGDPDYFDPAKDAPNLRNFIC